MVLTVQNSKCLVDCIAVVGAGNDLKDNLRVAVVKDLEAALSLAEAMRGRDYLQQAGCRFEETEAADIIQQANFFPESLS